MTDIKSVIKTIIRENFIKEMHKNDIHYRAIMKYYDKGTPSTKKQVSIVVTGKKASNRGQIINDLLEMDYYEILDIEKKLKFINIHKEYFDKKGNERVAAALPQTEEEPVNERRGKNRLKLSKKPKRKSSSIYKYIKRGL